MPGAKGSRILGAVEDSGAIQEILDTSAGLYSRKGGERILEFAVPGLMFGVLWPSVGTLVLTTLSPDRYLLAAGLIGCLGFAILGWAAVADSAFGVVAIDKSGIRRHSPVPLYSFLATADEITCVTIFGDRKSASQIRVGLTDKRSRFIPLPRSLAKVASSWHSESTP